MIELLPFQMIPLIQLWATISVLFFYQPFFEKHPLVPQLNELNKPLDRFCEQYQGFISSSNYLAVKWDSFFVSIRRMTALIFFYSIFLLFYLGIYKYHYENRLELYHFTDIFFLTTTNLYMLLWLSWHLLKPIRKIWKLVILFIIEFLERIIKGLQDRKFLKLEKSKLGKMQMSIKKKRLQKSNAILAPRKKRLSNTNIRIIRMYCIIFFLFFVFLLLYFLFFEYFDSILKKYEKSLFLVHHSYSTSFFDLHLNIKNPTFETISVFVTLFLIVPSFILVRILVDYIQIKHLRNIFHYLPKEEDTELLLDVLSMRKEDIQKMSSKQIFLTVKEFKGKAQGDILEKQDIRDYLQDKVDMVITALAKGLLDINTENPIRGEKFSTNQENQIEKVVKRQIDLSNEKLLDYLANKSEPITLKQDDNLGVRITSKPSPRIVSRMLKYLFYKELRKLKKLKKNKSN